jgi:hypothetical protein
MKASLKSIVGSLVMSSILTACNEGGTSSKGTIKTNFSMTSSNEVTVAQNNIQKLLSTFIPTAIALEPLNLKDSGLRSVDLDEAWIVLKKIQFTSIATDDSNSSDDSIHYKGPFYVDLLSNNPVSFGEINLPVTGIRRVKMLLHKATNGDFPSIAPSQLIGNSIYLKGQVNGLNFSFAADDTTDFSISGPNAVVPEEGKDFLAVLRMADLFKKIDLSDISEGTNISSSNRIVTSTNDPCPEIHSQANNLYTCFKKGIALSAKFGKDNGDKDLTSNDEIVNE